MPEEFTPGDPQELAQGLLDAAEAGQVIELGGGFSKRRMGGPVAQPERIVSTSRLKRLLAYEPADLTVAVEAGMTVGELDATLAAKGQFLPLDPCMPRVATIGGALASGLTGPRQRRYGSARDLVIGMEFATLEGKIVQSGGMVVKNVTGLDMAKLLIGSYGTLAAMTRVNFKVFPKPDMEKTFVFASREAPQVFKLGRFMLKGPLQPVSMEMLSPALSAALSSGLHTLIVQASGNAASMERYEKFYRGVAIQQAAVEFSALDDAQATAVWQYVRDIRQQWLNERSAAFVLRVSWLPSQVERFYETLGGADGETAVIGRLPNGVAWVLCDGTDDARSTLKRLRDAQFETVVEASPEDQKDALEAWASPREELAVMRRIKGQFDPNGLLNPGRLMGRI